MLKQLRLTCFRQHVNRVFDFSDGINVIRGPNEGGKSTMLEALSYLWGGSATLSEPLADVVTYEHSEKELRVEGDWTIDGVDYTGYRCASGAEIAYGDQRVSGQRAVTQFMERLLGAKMDTVKKLLIAEQGAIRGVLSSEAGAGALIEQLADLELVEQYIEKIQAQLPCGPTKAQEAAIHALQEAVGSEPEMPSSADLFAAEEAEASAKKLYEQANEVVRAKDDSFAAAQSLLGHASAQAVRRETMQKRRDNLLKVSQPAACAWTYADVAQAEKAENDAKFAAKVSAERGKSFETADNFWTGSEEEARAEVAKLRSISKELLKKASAAKVSAAGKLATKISEGICSFCKKDISDMPEVAETNARVDSEVLALRAEVAKFEAQSESALQDVAAIEALLQMHSRNLSKATAGFWEPQAGRVPAVMAWTGPQATDSQTVSTPSSEIKAAIASYETAKIRYEAAQQELATLEIPDEIPADKIADAQAVTEDYALAQRSKGEAHTAFFAAAQVVQIEKAKLDAAVKNFEAAKQRRQQTQKQVSDARDLLAKMVFNNELIKDLRSARSELRRKLWGIVLAAISVYFSRIRQVETVIAQTEDGFTQNGKPVKGLSGSAKDMLGLSIRAALMKTFIPGATLLVVDEPFSGCDDNREAAGIGTLSAMGFDQTILVTHSDLADSVANRLIQL